MSIFDDIADFINPDRKIWREMEERQKTAEQRAIKEEAERLREQAKNPKGTSEADFKRQIALQAIVKAKTDANLAKIYQLKTADNQQKDLNKDEIAKFKQETLDKIEAMKANAGIEDAPRGEKAALRRELADKIKAYRAQRKAELAKLRVAGKAKVQSTKVDAKKYADNLRKENNSLNSPFSTVSGFYTDANGKKRPITPRK
jgi:membrane protein involved in colicin uptake